MASATMAASLRCRANIAVLLHRADAGQRGPYANQRTGRVSTRGYADLADGASRIYVLFSGGGRMRDEPCGSALKRLKAWWFDWSLNPYMGCARQCTFCYVRTFEKRADRPSDDRPGAWIRVKTNIAEVPSRSSSRSKSLVRASVLASERHDGERGSIVRAA